MKKVVFTLVFGILSLISQAQNSETFIRNFETDSGLYGKITFIIKNSSSYKLSVNCKNISIEGINTSEGNYTNRDLVDYGILFPINNAKGYFVVNGKTTVWVEELTELGKEISGTGRYETASFDGNSYVYHDTGATYSANYSKYIKDLVTEVNKNKKRNLWRETGKAWPKNSVYIRGINISDRYGINDAIKSFEEDKENKRQFDNLIAEANNAKSEQEKLNILIRARQYANDNQLDELKSKIYKVENIIEEQKIKEEEERLAEVEKKKKEQENANLAAGTEKRKKLKEESNYTSSKISKTKYKESPNIITSERNHQNDLKAINEKYRKIAYKSSIDHKNKILDLKLQQILNDPYLDSYEKSYKLNDIGLKRQVLASNTYYTAQQQRIQENYTYKHNNTNVALASTIINSVQQISEQNRIRKRRNYLRSVYEERKEFQRAFNKAHRNLESLNDYVKNYLTDYYDFEQLKEVFSELFWSIYKVNEFKFNYRNEHKDIDNMFFNNNQKLSSLFEKLYVREFSKGHNSLESALKLFSIEQNYYDYLSKSTKEYLADFIAIELSQKGNDFTINKIFSNLNIIERSFKNQKEFYKKIITEKYRGESKKEILNLLNRFDNDIITLALLKTNIDLNNKNFYSKYRNNEVVIDFLQNEYTGNLILLEDTTDNDILLARNIKTKLYGYIDNSKEWIIDPNYKTAQPFIGKKALVRKSYSGSYLLINQKGNIIKTVENIEVLSEFRNDYAVAKEKYSALKGIVNSNLEWVKKPKYVKINLPSDPNEKITVQTQMGSIKKFKLK